MKHASQTDFGRQANIVLSSGAVSSPQDKWALLAALTDAANIYELNHRTLGVLKALLSFWPDRELSPAPNSCIVFPSNRTLASRLNGMPESTLRRHLSQLVKLGIVSRHDSPNQKRYARRISGALAQAYGFDLSPLARHADHLMEQACLERQAQEKLMILRDNIAQQRQELITAGGDTELTEQARLILRRKPQYDQLQALQAQLGDALNQHPRSCPEAKNTPAFVECTSPEMSGTDTQNERHIQDSIKQSFDSEKAENIRSEKTDPISAAAQDEMQNKKQPSLTLGHVLERCKEGLSFFPDPVRNWSDLVYLADRLAPMLGIDQPVLAQAKHIMGSNVAAISLLCILERATEIRSPGAYLRRLTQKAAMDGFSVVPMLSALKPVH